MTVEEMLKATGINIGDNGIGADTLRYDGWLQISSPYSVEQATSTHVVCQSLGNDHSFSPVHQHSM